MPKIDAKEARRLRKEKKRSAVGEALDNEQVIKAVEPKKHGVWIGNLAYSTTIPKLQKYLEQHTESTVQKVKMPHTPITPQIKTRIKDMSICSRGVVNKGFAIVYFETEQGVEDALRLSDCDFDGRKLLIKKQDNYDNTGTLPRPTTSKVKAKKELVPNTKLFVGNLNFDVTREQLQGWLQQYGDIVNIRIAQFEDSGKCRGFAYVIFNFVDQAVACVEAATKGFLEVEPGVRIKVEFGSVPDTKRPNGTIADATARFMQRTQHQTNYRGDSIVPDPCAIPRVLMNTRKKFEDE